VTGDRPDAADGPPPSERSGTEGERESDSGNERESESEFESTRTRARATIRVSAADPETVAAALAPDDTTEVTTRIEDGRVLARIGRPTVGGLRTTADDYVTNLQVATQLITDTTHP